MSQEENHGKPDSNEEQLHDGSDYGSEDEDEYSYYDSDADDMVLDPVSTCCGPFGTTEKSNAQKTRYHEDMKALDTILVKCDEAFPEAISEEDQAFHKLVLQKQLFACRPETAPSETPKKAKTTVTQKTKKKSFFDSALGLTKAKAASTSTGKAGVGYATDYSGTDDASLKEKMKEAKERQEELDKACCELLSSLCRTFEDFEGDEGIAHVSLKMSQGLNRMLFSLFKNESMLDWVQRKAVYQAGLAFVLKLCDSKFLSSFLVHDLLEGDGSGLRAGSSSCRALLISIESQACTMKKRQEQIVAQLSKHGNGSQLSPEQILARDTLEVCNSLATTRAAIEAAIQTGREAGTIPQEHQPHAESDKEGETAHQSDPATLYVDTMRRYQFENANLSKDHHFAKSAETANPSVQVGRMIRIHSELTSLSSGLPVEWASGIFLRVHEDQPDLMKACIMAPEDTPYASGAFLFDILLPAAYPSVSPQVQFRTTGNGAVRFNPNLYSCGRVCLSLLGTWSGPGWIQETSSVLQVLVSIQSLIFVNDPYFNEPGYDATSEREHAASKVYNHRVRVATLKWAILEQLTNPPPEFADCMLDHFRLKKRAILEQLDYWEQLANDYDDDATAAQTRGRISGGMDCSKTIVSKLCNTIRDALEKKFPEKNAKGVGA